MNHSTEQSFSSAVTFKGDGQLKQIQFGFCYSLRCNMTIDDNQMAEKNDFMVQLLSYLCGFGLDLVVAVLHNRGCDSLYLGCRETNSVSTDVFRLCGSASLTSESSNSTFDLGNQGSKGCHGNTHSLGGQKHRISDIWPRVSQPPVTNPRSYFL